MTRSSASLSREVCFVFLFVGMLGRGGCEAGVETDDGRATETARKYKYILAASFWDASQTSLGRSLDAPSAVTHKVSIVHVLPHLLSSREPC
jgi:hypothetical protein